MKYFAGLDVSLVNTAVCVVDLDGEIVHETVTETDPAELTNALVIAGYDFELVGFEAGSLSAWLHKDLSAAGFSVVCIDARHAAAALKAQNVKTDRNDARGIAHILRTGWFRASHIKSDESAKRRVLLNARKALLSKRFELESQIRGNLKVFGLKVGHTTAIKYEARIRELIEDDAELLSYLEPLLDVRRLICTKLSELDKKVRSIAKGDEVCRRFMSIPGVGPITAMAYKSTVDNPYRFKKSANVGVHLGLTPRKYASGQVDRNGHITKTGDAMTRTYLYEAAQVLMRGSSPDCDLKKWGSQVAKKGSKKRAIVGVARKLSVIMHRMWIDGVEFSAETC